MLFSHNNTRFSFYYEAASPLHINHVCLSNSTRLLLITFKDALILSPQNPISPLSTITRKVHCPFMNTSHMNKLVITWKFTSTKGEFQVNSYNLIKTSPYSFVSHWSQIRYKLICHHSIQESVHVLLFVEQPTTYNWIVTGWISKVCFSVTKARQPIANFKSWIPRVIQTRSPNQTTTDYGTASLV